jgi:hypothetical protein
VTDAESRRGYLIPRLRHPPNNSSSRRRKTASNKVPGGYVVRDANGQALAYLYSRDNDAEARQAKVLTSDEGRRIAANIARLPVLLGTGSRQNQQA